MQQVPCECTTTMSHTAYLTDTYLLPNAVMCVGKFDQCFMSKAQKITEEIQI